MTVSKLNNYNEAVKDTTRIHDPSIYLQLHATLLIVSTALRCKPCACTLHFRSPNVNWG